MIAVADLAEMKREVATDLVKRLTTDLAVTHLEEKYQEEQGGIEECEGEERDGQGQRGEKGEEGDEVSVVKVKSAMHDKVNLGIAKPELGLTAPSESDVTISIQVRMGGRRSFLTSSDIIKTTITPSLRVASRRFAI